MIEKPEGLRFAYCDYDALKSQIAVICQDEVNETVQCVLIYGSSSGGWIEKQQIDVSVAEEEGDYGLVMDDGSLVLVSSDYYDGKVGDGISLFLYEYDGEIWICNQHIPLDSCFNLAIDGETLVVGRNIEGTEVAEVYQKSAGVWKFQELLWLPTTDMSASQYRVAIDGETIVVSAYADQYLYVYSNSGAGWIYETMLLIPTYFHENTGASWNKTPRFWIDNDYLVTPSYSGGDAFVVFKKFEEWERYSEFNMNYIPTGKDYYALINNYIIGKGFSSNMGVWSVDVDFDPSGKHPVIVSGPSEINGKTVVPLGSIVELTVDARVDGCEDESMALRYWWDKIDGPGKMVFKSATHNPGFCENIYAQFEKEGTYTIRVRVYSYGKMATANMTIDVVNGIKAGYWHETLDVGAQFSIDLASLVRTGYSPLVYTIMGIHVGNLENYEMDLDGSELTFQPSSSTWNGRVVINYTATCGDIQGTGTIYLKYGTCNDGDGPLTNIILPVEDAPGEGVIVYEKRPTVFEVNATKENSGDPEVDSVVFTIRDAALQNFNKEIFVDLTPPYTMEWVPERAGESLYIVAINTDGCESTPDEFTAVADLPKTLLYGSGGDGCAILSWSYESSNYQAVEYLVKGTTLKYWPDGEEGQAVEVENLKDSRWNNVDGLINDITYQFELITKYDLQDNDLWVHEVINLVPQKDSTPIIEVNDFQVFGDDDSALILWRFNDFNYANLADSQDIIGFLIHRQDAPESDPILRAALPVVDKQHYLYHYIDKDLLANHEYIYTITPIDRQNHRSTGIAKSIVTLEESGTIAASEDWPYVATIFEADQATPGSTNEEGFLWGGLCYDWKKINDIFDPDKADFPLFTPANPSEDSLSWEIQGGDTLLHVSADYYETQYYQALLTDNDIFSVRFSLRLEGENPYNVPVSIMEWKNLSGKLDKIRQVVLYQDKICIGNLVGNFYHGNVEHEYTITRVRNNFHLYVADVGGENRREILLTQNTGNTHERGENQSFALIRFGISCENPNVTAVWRNLEHLTDIVGYFEEGSVHYDVTRPNSVVTLQTTPDSGTGVVNVQWMAPDYLAQGLGDVAAYRITVDGLSDYVAFVPARNAEGDYISNCNFSTPIPLPLNYTLYVHAVREDGIMSEASNGSSFQLIPNSCTVQFYFRCLTLSGANRLCRL